MDPTSQDNSFGSFGPGGNNPGVSGGVPPVGGAANNPMAPTGLEQMGEMGQSSQTNQMWQANQMNQMGMGPAVVSSDSGDVVIGNERKPKIWLVIGVIIAVLLVTLGIVFVVMNNTGSGKDINRLKGSFNRFANYTLSGQELDIQIDPEIDLDGDYYLNNNEENKTEMYNKIEELFSVFKEQYFQSDVSKTVQQSEYYDDIVNAEGDLAVFMSKVYIKDLPSEQDLMASYAMNGRDATLDAFKNYYPLDELSNNRYVADFYNHYKEWLDGTINILDIYNASGCLDNKKIIVTCSLTEQQIETITDLVKNIDGQYAVLSEGYELSNHFIRMIYIINSLINNEDVSNYVLLVDDNYYEDGELRE